MEIPPPVDNSPVPTIPKAPTESLPSCAASPFYNGPDPLETPGGLDQAPAVPEADEGHPMDESVHWPLSPISPLRDFPIRDVQPSRMKCPETGNVGEPSDTTPRSPIFKTLENTTPHVPESTAPIASTARLCARRPQDPDASATVGHGSNGSQTISRKCRGAISFFMVCIQHLWRKRALRNSMCTCGIPRKREIG